MTYIIQASRIYWPAFVEPTAAVITNNEPRYGCFVFFNDVPPEIHSSYVVHKEPSKRALEMQPHLLPAPAIQAAPDHDERIRRLARARQTVRACQDRQHQTGPALLAVEPVESIERNTFVTGGAPILIKALQIVAIQVSIADLRDNFERLLTEYFP